MAIRSNPRPFTVKFLASGAPQFFVLFMFSTLLFITLMGLPFSAQAQLRCSSVLTLPSQSAGKIHAYENISQSIGINLKLHKDFGQTFICCEPVSATHLESSIDALSLEKNPYTLGLNNPGSFPSDFATYSYFAPDVLYGTSVSKLNYKNNSQPLFLRITSFLKGKNPFRYVTKIGQGSLSKVYFFDLKAPFLGSSDWLNSSAKYVVKFRHYFAGNDEHYLNYFKRDLAIRGLAVELSARALFKGKSFIRVANDYSTPEDLIAGRMTQEAIHGPSAVSLAEALKNIEIGLQKKDHETLRQAGIDPNDPAAIHDLKERLAALEKFYLDTHDDVLLFSIKNLIPGLGNRTSSGALANVGFDFGHGNNVHIDPKTGQWVMIDW